MEEKERIITLVKEGIISSEEALVLLEQLGQKAAEAASQETVKETTTNHKKETSAESMEADDQNNLNKILEGIASALTSFSADVDGKDQTLKTLYADIQAKKDRLAELDVMKELDEWSSDQEMEAQRIKEELDSLDGQAKALEEDKKALEEEMARLKKEEMDEAIKKMKEKVESAKIKESVNETMNQVGSTASKLGEALSNLFSSGFKNVMDNVEWETKEFNIPKLASQKFTHTIESPTTSATIVDVKVANGEVKFKTWDLPYVKIEGNYKLYGAFEEDTPLEIFENRSKVVFDEEKITFHIPNKRIYADLIIYLPRQEYDYISVQALNASIRLKDIQGKDFYLKSVNGDVLLKNITGTMVEIDSVNGTSKVIDCTLRDLISKKVAGKSVIKSDIVSSKITSVSGSIKVEATKATIKKMNASTVSGSISVQIDKDQEFEAKLSTALGKLDYESLQAEVINETKDTASKKVHLRKVTEGAPVQINLSTTTGSVRLLAATNPKKDKSVEQTEEEIKDIMEDKKEETSEE